MLRVVLILMALVAGVAEAAAADFNNQIIIYKPLILRDGKETVSLQPGQHYATFAVGKDEIEIEIHLRPENKIVKVELQIPKGERFSVERIQFRSADLRQDFDLSGYSFFKQEVGKAQITKEGDCVRQKFTTQDNCRIVTDYEPASSCDLTGKNCMWPAKETERLQCDSREHVIMGRNVQTVVAEHTESNRGIAFRDPANGTLLADLVSSRFKSTHDKILSETDCR